MAVRYVERNPVRAGLVDKSEDYPWSSALSHITGVNNPILSDDLFLLKEIPDWRRYLSVDEEETILKQIRGCTAAGRPVGSEPFVTRLEELLGRTLKPKSVGRPKKNK